MIKGKKAMLGPVPLTKIIELIFIIIFFVALIGVTSYSIKTEFDTTEISISLFFNRLYTSPAINYVDAITSKAYPGVIDLEKFKALKRSVASNPLERDISYGNAKVPIGAKIVLYDSSNAELADFTYNSKKQIGYDELKSRSYAMGLGATTERTFTIPVAIKTNDAIINGKIEYNIIVANS